LEEDWTVNGIHYSRTLEAWLERQDLNKDALLPILAKTYGEDQARLWFQRWRMFWLACSELFKYNDGNEWPVHQYRFKNAALHDHA
ncbi:MAG: SAM-dependent methyltransferase, partial [Kiritimatiellae bacterium]|nr:SAM-dependent methyltransferase [Kiritimatiellia bacterium]